MIALAPRWRVFALTYLAYATYYLTRKPFSVDKTTITETLGVTMGELSAIDTAYLALYAVGQLVWGVVADRVGARRLIGGGMVLVSAFALLFGVSSTAVAFGLAFALLGLVQATGWPGTVRAMTPWFSTAERGRVMGPWSTCYQLGGLLATALASFVLVRLGWRATFFVPVALTLVVAAAVWLGLPEPPAERAAEPASGGTREAEPPPRLWSEPLLWTLGGAYFVLKLVRYTLLFWLPYVLTTRLGVDKGAAGNYSIAFEAGGILGAYAIGALSDRVSRRGLLALVMVAGLTLAMQQLSVSTTVEGFTFMVAVCGFFLFGPDALISGIAAQEIGGTRGVGRAAGIINGVGSVGGLCQGLVTVVVVERLGWSALFSGFVVACGVATLLLIPYARRRRALH